MRKERQEFSKWLARWTLIGFGMQIAVTVVACICWPAAAEALLNQIGTSVALVSAVLLGYLGKAGVENYKKIGQDEQKNDGRN